MIYCCNCKKDINEIVTSGKEIYPHRPDLYNLIFYKCPKCGNYVGSHKESLKPLGCIPTKELKRARIKIHSIMDPLWKSGKISRKTLYKRISDMLGYRYHNAETRTIEECNQALIVVQQIKKQLEEV